MHCKKVKVSKSVKTSEQREAEVENLMQQFMDFGFPLDNEGVQEFIKRTKQFVDSGLSDSGKIKLNGFNRILIYVFSKQPHITSRITLQFDKYV